MKTATLEVTDRLGIFDFAAVEKRLASLAGVRGVAINALLLKRTRLEDIRTG